MVKVYFAGSIRGGRADAELYYRMIVYIQGKGCNVLTEHVGSKDLSVIEQGKKDVGIYEQDTAWLRESDVLTQLSAMLTGDNYFNIHPYEKEEEIYPIIEKILAV